MYANVVELTRCLDDCIEYCHKFPDREHCTVHLPLLRQARRDLEDTTKRSDREFTQWRMEGREDRQAWKQLAKKLKSIQKKLARVNAIGYVDHTINYWDQEALVEAVDEMIDYLRARTDDLEFAEDDADRLERQKNKARSENKESGRALEEYIRFSKLRADGLTHARDTIANFRLALRRSLGVRAAEYQAIRWPQNVASDRSVL